MNTSLHDHISPVSGFLQYSCFGLESHEEAAGIVVVLAGVQLYIYAAGCDAHVLFYVTG